MKIIRAILPTLSILTFILAINSNGDPWIPIGQPQAEEMIFNFVVKGDIAYALTAFYPTNNLYIKENCFDEQSPWRKVTNNIELSPGEHIISIEVTVNPNNPDSTIIFVGTRQGYPSRLLKSCDRGSTWTVCHKQQFHPHERVVVDPKDWRKIWVAPWPGLIVSEDLGDHWSYVNPPDSQYVSSICFDPNNHETVYVSTVGIEPHYGAVFKTINGGQYWVEKSSGLPENIDWTAMDADPHVSDVLYLIPTFFHSPPWGDEFSLYKTTTGGEWWERQVVLAGQAHPAFRCARILVNPYYSNIIYLGDSLPGRFLQSCDRGSSWVTVIDEAVMGIMIDPTNPQNVYIAFEDGIWCYQDPLVGISNSWNGTQLPNNSVLFQNYPNPFNTSTHIEYQISTTSTVRVILKIYNIFGGEVATLVDGPHNSGYYQISWNGQDNYGTDVGSGIYFCRLQIGNHIVCKKMLLLK